MGENVRLVHRDCSCSACPREIGKAGFPLFFPNRRSHCAAVRTLICICRAGNNLTSSLSSFSVFIPFFAPDLPLICVCHDSKKRGVPSSCPQINDLAQFSPPPLTGPIRMIQLNSARSSRISRRLIFFRGSPWTSRGNREPRWTTNCVHLLRGGSKVRPFMNRDPINVLVTSRTLLHLHTHT